jgi:hypothetical protein
VSLSIKKVRGSDTFEFLWSNEGKTISWFVDGSDVEASTLLDIVDTIAPREALIPPTMPQYPVGMGINPQLFFPPNARDWNTVTIEHNVGAEAADRAAQEEEMRLRNMGSALATGVGLPADAIPVVDSDRNDMGPVNWSA